MARDSLGLEPVPEFVIVIFHTKVLTISIKTLQFEVLTEELPGGFDHAVLSVLVAGEQTSCFRSNPRHFLDVSSDFSFAPGSHAVFRHNGFAWIVPLSGGKGRVEEVRKAFDIDHRVRFPGDRATLELSEGQMWSYKLANAQRDSIKPRKQAPCGRIGRRVTVDK